MQTRSSGLPILARTGDCVAWRTGSGLIWLDRRGQSIAEAKATFLKHAASSDASTIATLEKIIKAGEREGETTLALRWFDREGRPQGNYIFSQHSDDPLPQFLFDTAGSNLLVVQPAIARLIFLNRSGQVTREQQLFSDAPYSLERPFLLAASAEAFVVLSQPAPSTTGKLVAPVLCRFSVAGDELWRRELAPGTAGALAISDDGRWLVAARYAVVSDEGAHSPRVESTVSFFNHRGDLLVTVNGLFRQALFAKNGARALLMDRRQLRMVSLPSGKLQWQINLSRKTEMLVDIAATAGLDKIFALAGASVFKDNRFLFENNRLLGFNGQGKQQFATSLKQALSSPKLLVSEDGQKLVLAAEGLLQNFIVSNVAK
ncbi:MAG: hypothetical protein ONB45_00090 [candidate division KSB1 bacterium]|nr:hypothetical protein [candidate division KSB1 bacterium]